MDAVRQYLLSITAAAIFCAILTALAGNRGTQGTVLKLLTGLFMAVTVISPLKQFDFSLLQYSATLISSDGQTAAEAGLESAEKQMRQIILEQTQAYILDKGAALGLDLTVEVTLSDDMPAVPQTVTIKGEASPYAKNLLRSYITEDLNIPEEDQMWI